VAHQARKRFGQHFLVDSGIIHAIVRAIEPDLDDAVIEIGPGLGAMTRPLLASLNQMSVVELDRDLVKRWQNEAIANLTIHEADALKFDFLAWASQAKQQLQQSKSLARVKIVGNLPYNISSPLLFHLMSAADIVDEQVFMLQAEVIERMVAQHGDSEYSRLSVMLQSRYHMENVLDVPPDAFDPPPKVDSAVVKMIPRKDLKLSPEEYRSLESLVLMAFAQRRKVLRNNLSTVKDRLGLKDDILGLIGLVGWRINNAHFSFYPLLGSLVKLSCRFIF
jgi:16S rRNA (adenine1518-N6/adenine1519-N6)-dimethyltransferase